MNELLTGIEQALNQERELFGDELLIDDQSTPRETVVAGPKPQKGEELLLFDLAPSHQPRAMAEPWGGAATLQDLEANICGCLKCPLGQRRTKFVFGVGNSRSTMMLIGEAPGADEDAQGEPFVGRAGQLLNKILGAIHFQRNEVYICNILKCRPPENRKPLPEEVEKCIPYLKKQIALVKPRLILCLGLTAAENLLQTRESLTKLRGRVFSYEGIPLMVTYHPAALLRNPNWKRPAWEDVQAARQLHDELAAKDPA